ncbi:hypothetical protein L7F22_039640 [Adiantum nelumboides]|nr:hypothetical protein [Adiantum nelumboides]
MAQKLSSMHLISTSLGLLLYVLCCSLPLASAQTDCTTPLTALQPCFPYVTAGNTTNPGTDCCSPLGNLFAVNATCLCQIAPLAQQLNININQSRALEIAILCNQTVPSAVTDCLSDLGNSTVTPPPPPPTATDGSSGTAPSNNSTDGSNAIYLSPPSLLFGSFLAFLSLHLVVPF